MEIEPQENRKNYFKFPFILAMIILAMATTIYIQVESNQFNTYISEFLMPTHEYRYTLVSIMVSASALTGTVAFLIFGAISDNLRWKYGRRVPLILLGCITTGILMISFGYSKAYWYLLVCDGFLMGFSSNLFWMGQRTLVPDLMTQQQRGKANTIVFAATMIGGIIFMVLSGMLVVEGDVSQAAHQRFFWLGGISLWVAGVVVVLCIKEPKIEEPAEKWTKSLARIFNRKEMAQHGAFLRFFVASIFFIMANASFMPYMLSLLFELEFENNQLLILLCVLLPSAIAGVVLIAYFLDRKGRKKVTVIALSIGIVGAGILGFSSGQFILVVIGMALLFPVVFGLGIATDTWTADLLPKGSEGRFLGIINIGKAAGQIPGVMLAAFMADTFGIITVYLVTGLFLAVAIPFFLRVPETMEK